MELPLSVIVISYNTSELTRQCLRVLESELNGIHAEVWVVDNASDDGSQDAIHAEFPSVHLIRNDRNVGFAAANNQALAQTTGKFLLLLNSDAFLKPGALSTMLEFMGECEDVAVVAPRLLNSNGSLQRSCWRFPTPARSWIENLGLNRLLRRWRYFDDYSGWPHDVCRFVDFAIGACLLVRRRAYVDVGDFDERFFLYGEEMDWQRRFTQRDWKVAFTPKAEVTHVGRASSVTQRPGARASFYNGMDTYQLKHHGWLGLLSVRLAMAFGGLLRTVLWSIVFLANPHLRSRATQKLRLHGWLTLRQLTDWRAFMAYR